LGLELEKDDVTIFNSIPYGNFFHQIHNLIIYIAQTTDYKFKSNLNKLRNIIDNIDNINCNIITKIDEHKKTIDKIIGKYSKQKNIDSNKIKTLYVGTEIDFFNKIYQKLEKKEIITNNDILLFIILLNRLIDNKKIDLLNKCDNDIILYNIYVSNKPKYTTDLNDKNLITEFKTILKTNDDNNVIKKYTINSSKLKTALTIYYHDKSSNILDTKWNNITIKDAVDKISNVITDINNKVLKNKQDDTYFHVYQLTRFLNLKSKTGELFDPTEFKKNDIIYYPYFLSTSYSNCYKFSAFYDTTSNPCCCFKIKIKNNFKNYIIIGEYSHYGDEYEVLIDKGCSLKISDKYFSNIKISDKEYKNILVIEGEIFYSNSIYGGDIIQPNTLLPINSQTILRKPVIYDYLYNIYNEDDCDGLLNNYELIPIYNKLKEDIDNKYSERTKDDKQKINKIIKSTRVPIKY